MLEARGLTKCYASLPGRERRELHGSPGINSGLPGAERLGQKHHDGSGHGLVFEEAADSPFELLNLSNR